MSKITGSIRSLMPIPVSVTVTTSSPPRTSAARMSVPPVSVNLAALLSRFSRTWASRVKSAYSVTGPGGSLTSSRCWRASISGRAASTALLMTSFRSIRSFCKIILPVVMREMSRRSLTRRTSWCSWRAITSRAERTIAASPPAFCNSSSAVRNGASGLRNSCARVARNSSLRWSAASSAFSAPRRSAISCWSARFDASSASARRPISASMSLNASTR